MIYIYVYIKEGNDVLTVFIDKNDLMYFVVKLTYYNKST